MSDAPRDSFFGRRVAPDASLASLGRERAPRAEPPPPTTAGPHGADAIDALKDKFEPRPPRGRLEDLIVAAETLAAIETVFARIEHHEVLYRDWGLDALEPQGRRIALNLYGPPGTGKTLCAEAIAHRLGRPIVEVGYAEIESKYVGETPKNVVAAFRRAREAGAVLFFDEADSILGRRMTNVTQAADHGVNVSRAVMLKELDAFTGVVVFATNLARNFDSAFVRRILAHIEMPAPDEPTRRRLWEKLLPARLPGRADLDAADLARRSEGLVGGEIKNAVILAASRAVVRTGAERRVTTVDLTDAIERVRRAKQEVGPEDAPPARRTVAIDEVAIEPSAAE